MLNTDRLCLGCMNDNGEADVCPICGYDAKTKNPKDALPTKFWIWTLTYWTKPVT